MHRLSTRSLSLVLGMAVVAWTGIGCGGDGKKGPDDPSSKTDTSASTSADKSGDGDKSGGETKEGEPSEGAKKNECVSFDTPSLDDALVKSACEVPNAKPDTLSPIDIKGKVEVTVTASPTKVAPGGKADLLVTFANKTKEPITLQFRIDPMARFEVEVYDKKNKRVDMPAGNPPPPPKGHSAPPPADAKVAKITIAANGTARQRVPWEAVRMGWAPEKVRGTPAERGYPRKPAGPLPKGKYSVKVVTPLVGVSEGPEHEISAPKVEIEVG